MALKNEIQYPMRCVGLYIRYLSAACAMSNLDSRVREVVDAVVDVMKAYDSSSPPRWDVKTVHGVLRDATRDINDPVEFTGFATALANKIEERVTKIKKDFHNNQYPWFLNFSNESYFDSVIHNFQDLTRNHKDKRELNISILSPAEFENSYLSFVHWLEKDILNELRIKKTVRGIWDESSIKKSVEDILEVKILCEQWYSVARFSSGIEFHRDMLQNVIYIICDEIEDREIITSFKKYVRIHTHTRDDATPNGPLFERPVVESSPFKSKLEALSTRVDTLWLRLQNFNDGHTFNE